VAGKNGAGGGIELIKSVENNQLIEKSGRSKRTIP
jgi:hypothetical protein